jgi:hypothetical protein
MAQYGQWVAVTVVIQGWVIDGTDRRGMRNTRRARNLRRLQQAMCPDRMTRMKWAIFFQRNDFPHEWLRASRGG